MDIEKLIVDLQEMHDEILADSGNCVSKNYLRNVKQRQIIQGTIIALKQANFISSKNVLPAAKSFPLKQSECKHREQPRTWHKEYSTWRCDGCGKWYE